MLLTDTNSIVVVDLRKLGFKQLVCFPTHIEGRVIDLVFINWDMTHDPHTVDQQSSFFSDHDLIFVNSRRYCIVII